MRRSDIVTIILVALIGVFCTYFLGNMFIGDPGEAMATVKVIEPITAELVEPDSEVFNESAVNPTVEVYVGRCKDLDQNGSIDEVERESCNREGGESENDVNGGDQTTEGD